MEALARRKHREVIEELLELDGARVADIGCGDGALTRLMTRLGARVTGIDPSEGQLAPQQIEHYFMVTTAQEKEANLARILEDEDPESAIIFCNTKDDVRFVTAYLQRRGFDADQISGDWGAE